MLRSASAPTPVPSPKPGPHAAPAGTARLPGTRLSQVAALTWLVSLALPGFMPDTRVEHWYGAYILVLGLPMGWIVHGWAVYANLFFARAAFLMWRGRQPGASVAGMLMLAATLPMFRGVMRDEGASTVLPVASWGWGAVLWLVALGLMAVAAAVRAGWLSRWGSRVAVAVLAAVPVAAAALFMVQWLGANAQERGLYLSPGLAFTLAPRCGVPFTEVAAPRVPPGSAVALEVDPSLLDPSGRRPALALPAALREQAATPGFAWVTHRDPVIESVTVRVRHAAGPDNPVVQARATPEGALLRLLARPGGPVLYEQRLKQATTLSGRPVFCPLAAGGGFSGLDRGYDSQLTQALGQQVAPARVTLQDQVARMPCSLGADDLDGVPGLRLWDGRQVILAPESVRTRVGFCSESYIVLTYLSRNPAAKAAGLSPVAQVFDRRTLAPLAGFNDRVTCRMARCDEAPRDLATGVRIGDGQLQFETREGLLEAFRHPPR